MTSTHVVCFAMLAVIAVAVEKSRVDAWNTHAGSIVRRRNKNFDGDDVHRDIPNEKFPSCKNWLQSGSLLQAIQDPLTLVDKNGSIEHAFDDIYKDKKWGAGESLSGAGSSLRTTAVLCDMLQNTVRHVLATKKARNEPMTMRILDAPSGDFNWMSACLQMLDGSLQDGSFVSYSGADITQEAIKITEGMRDGVQRNLSHISIAPFKQLDLSDAATFAKFLEESGGVYDLILSHDALQHNSHDGVKKILENFNVGGRMLLVDVDRMGTNDKDISPGQFRGIDLTDDPYSYAPYCWDENNAPLQLTITAYEKEWFALFKLPL